MFISFEVVKLPTLRFKMALLEQALNSRTLNDKNRQVFYLFILDLLEVQFLDYLAPLIVDQMITIGPVANKTSGFVNFTTAPMLTPTTATMTESGSQFDCLAICVFVPSCCMAFYRNGSCFLGAITELPVNGSEALGSSQLFVTKSNFFKLFLKD